MHLHDWPAQRLLLLDAKKRLSLLCLFATSLGPMSIVALMRWKHIEPPSLMLFGNREVRSAAAPKRAEQVT